MSEAAAADRLLVRLIQQLQRRGKAPADALVGTALLAQRLGRRPLAGRLLTAAGRGSPESDELTSWLMHYVGRACADGDEPALSQTVTTLRDCFDRLVRADEVDLISGACGLGFMLWDLLDEGEQIAFAPALLSCSRRAMRLPDPGLFHGRGGGLLVYRTVSAGMIDADVVAAYPGEIPVPDPGADGLESGWVALCVGLPGILAALGDSPAATPLAALFPAARALLSELIGDPAADPTICHGLAGALLVAQQVPAWRNALGPELIGGLVAGLARHLDRLDDTAVAVTFDTPLVDSLLSGPLGVALALAETDMVDSPSWSRCLGLPALPQCRDRAASLAVSHV
jgi:hypothetical protein